MSLILCVLLGISAFAHPGSGIVIDKQGNVYFTDTGRGVWKIDTHGNLTYMPSQLFHWMAIDKAGSFKESRKNFGEWFERVTPQGSKPVLMICSDFPFTVNLDGNLYYADTRPSFSRIVRRTPGGEESVIMHSRTFQDITGIAAGPGGTLYVIVAGNTDTSVIQKITLDGTVSTIASFTFKDTALSALHGTNPSYCRGLAVDSQGIVYVAATGSRSVIKITAQGEVSTILQTSSPWSPTGVALFQGEAYVLEWRDASPAREEERKAWIPRVRKVGHDGTVTILATVSR